MKSKKAFKMGTEEFNYVVVALLITLILWIYILNSKDTEESKLMKIKLIIPDGMQVSNPVPKDILLRISGRRLTLNKFIQNDFSYELDLSKSGESVVTERFRADSFELPVGVNLVKVTPPFIKVKLEQVVTRDVLIMVGVEAGTPMEGLKLSTDPEKVTVKGVRSVISELKYVETENLNADKLKGGGVFKLSLKPVLGAEIKLDQPVEVKVEKK